ncbi:hypothetical protein GUJ93_ZPchr0007g4090 [Zizania palustris]|uniref:Uncharacterized protein n=1 Tax=Zizania palustris TaxID=103762 RepID=A0A8J5SJL9_ZIZPA|nr:hypothetical protein GUJ93_ZPchr0007g4090 [Zizania palustris]
MRRDLDRGDKWFGDSHGSEGGGSMGGGADFTRFGGKRKMPERGDSWGVHGGRGLGDGAFRGRGRRGSGGRYGHQAFRDDCQLELHGDAPLDHGFSRGDQQFSRASKGEDLVCYNCGAKGADSKTDAKQYRQASGFEESNSNSDKGGKVDIPEYLEDMSEDEVMDHEKKIEEDSGCDVAKNTIEDNTVGLSQSEGGSQKSQNLPVERPEDQNLEARMDSTSSSVVINDNDEVIPPVLGVISEEGAITDIPNSFCD